VAGLRRRRAGRGDCVVPCARTALRAHQRATRAVAPRRGSLSAGLAARLATAAVLILGLLAALLFLPREWLAGVVAAVVALAAFEWARLCRLSEHAARLYAAAAVTAYLILFYESADRIVFAAAAAYWLLVAVPWLLRGVAPRHAPALAVAGFLILVPAGLAMVSLRPTQVLLVIGLVSIADSAAYFAGRAWGRHKLAPAISPGKSWEGAIAGLVAGLAYAIICAAVSDEAAWLPYMGGAALLVVMSIFGDLFESAAKRQAAVKDSGSLLPGHGGVLDRIDSATATLPLAAFLWPLLERIK
jgi:phosphatidate cytidylyltransferase